MQNSKILPLIFADTSALIDMAKAEEYNDYHVPPSSETFNAQSLGDVFGKLTQRHTLVITREIFKELFPTHAGRLDLMKDDNSELTIPQNRHKLITHPDSLSLYNIFSDYARDGKVRCYSSIDAMTAAGEVDAPKGGIVIVDEGTLYKDLPPEGERVSEFKSDIFLQHVESIHGRRKVSGMGKRVFQDRGEDSLYATACGVNEYAQSKGLPQRFMVLNNDRRLNLAFEEEYQGVQPCKMRAYQIPWALAQGNQNEPDAISPQTANALHDALDAEYKERDYMMVSDPARGWRQTIEGANWLHGVEVEAAAPEAGKQR